MWLPHSMTDFDKLNSNSSQQTGTALLLQRKHMLYKCAKKRKTRRFFSLENVHLIEIYPR